MPRWSIPVVAALGGAGLLLGGLLLGGMIHEPGRAAPAVALPVTGNPLELTDEGVTEADVPVFAPVHSGDDVDDVALESLQPEIVGTVRTVLPDSVETGDGVGSDDTGSGGAGTTTTTTEPRLVQREPRTVDDFDEDDPRDDLVDRLRDAVPSDDELEGFDLATGEGFGVVDVDDVVGPLVDPGELRGAFVDRCAENRFGDCPIGVAALVLGPLGSGNPPLDIAVSVAADASSYRCAFGDPDPFDLRLWVATTNPAALEITYRLPPDDFGQVRVSTLMVEPPAAGGPERTRWQQRLDDGTVVDGPPIDWVQRCIVLPALVDKDTTYTVDVVATDDFGARAVGQGVGRPAPLDFPQPVISFRSEGRVRFGVVADRGQGGFAYPIDVSDGRETTCTDIEASHLTGRRTPSFEHPDQLMSLALGDGYTSMLESDSGRRWDFEFPLRAGRSYVICGWVYETGERSFDPIEVIHRYQYEVRAPNRHRAIVRATELTLTSPDPAAEDAYINVWALGGSGPCGPNVFTPRVGTAHDGPGRYRLQQTICDSGGRVLPHQLSIGVTMHHDGQRYSKVLGAVEIDDRKYCGDRDPACLDSAPPDLFTLPLDGLEGCSECGLEGSVSIAVDYRSSYGQGSGGQGWEVGLPEEFEADPNAGAEPTGDPRLDRGSWTADAVPDTIDQIRVTFVTDRAVTPTLRYTNDNRFCSDVTAVGPLATEHDILVEGLCADSTFTAIVTLEDEEGRTAEYTFGYGRAGRTLPLRGHLSAHVRLVEVQRDRVTQRCRQIEEWWTDNSWNVDLPSDCDQWLRLVDVDVEVEGFRLRPQQDQCIARNTGDDALAGGQIRSTATSNIVEVSVDMRLALEGCGAPARWTYLDGGTFVETIGFGEAAQTFVVALEPLASGMPARGVVDMNGVVFEVEFSFIQTFPSPE